VSQGLIRQSLRSFLTPAGRAKARPKYFTALRALRFVFCQTPFGSNPLVRSHVLNNKFLLKSTSCDASKSPETD